MIAAGRRSNTSVTASWIRSTGHGLGAEGLDEQADRVRLADRVGDLHLAARGQAGGDDVLGDPAHRVGGRAVDLRRVLAGEGAAAVAGHAAVGVDDDLAAGQAGVAHRAADLEAAGGVDQQPVAGGVDVEALQRPGSTTCSWMSAASSDSRSMSAACWVETTTVSRRTARSPSYSMVTWVLPSGRRYGIGPSLRTAASRCGEPVGQRDRQRHELGGVVAGVAEHQALVAGALAVERSVGVRVVLAVLVARRRRPGRCPATARRWRPRRRRRRRRSPSSRSRSRSRGSCRGRASGCRRTPRWSPHRRRAPGRW